MAQAMPLDSLLGPLMSVEDWAELPEGVPGELLAGRLVEEEMPDYVHEVIVAWLIRLLANWAEDRGAIVAGSEAKFALPGERGRKPDLTVFLAGSPRPPRRGVVHVAPDIMVEVVSRSPRDERRDRIEKLAEYAAFGVRWYWIVDPERRVVEIHELGASGSYALALKQSEGLALRVPGCPELELDLDALWAKTDSLTG